MKSNADNCHLLVSSNEKIKIANTKRQKPLGVHFDGDCHLIIIYQRFAENQVAKFVH